MTYWYVQPSYTTTAMNYDYALVTLATPATSGYLGLFFPPSNGTTETAILTTAGYPGSKPSGTMWSSACGSTSIDYSSNNAFANVQQCTGSVRPIRPRTSWEELAHLPFQRAFINRHQAKSLIIIISQNCQSFQSLAFQVIP
jgi:hypothetical protein